MQIRNITVAPSTFLSPMAGLTDSTFRRLIKRLGGCGLVMTEFTSAEGLTRHSSKSKRMLFYYDEERPITAQLFGSEPSRLAEATRMVEDLGFDAIDLKATKDKFVDCRQRNAAAAFMLLGCGNGPVNIEAPVDCAPFNKLTDTNYDSVIFGGKTQVCEDRGGAGAQICCQEIRFKEYFGQY